MNPINDKISENDLHNPPLVLKAKENVETTTDCKAENSSINAGIKTNDETKDMTTTVEKSNDSRKFPSELANENQVEEKNNCEKLPEKIDKPHETILKDNTKQRSNVNNDHKNDKDENQQSFKTDDKQSLKAKDAQDSLQVKMDNNSKDDPNEGDAKCTVTVNKPDENKQPEQIGSEEKSNNNSAFLDECGKQSKDKSKNMEIENESESEKADELDEEYEDVEIPEDDVEELIVPDEADAEDLTSLNGDDIDKSLNEDETTKDTDVDEQDGNETSANEEETTKDSEAADQDEKETYVCSEKIKNLSSNDDEVEDLTKDTEDGEIDNLTIEPELVALEEEETKDTASMIEDTRNDDDDVNNEGSTNPTTNDPLNCLDNQERHEECDNDENQSNLEGIAANDIPDEIDNDDIDREDNDDDEDDVQFVETRNSPICIESDEDDAGSHNKSEQMHNSNITTNPTTNKQTITTPTATITVPKNIIVTRTSARKSTAKLPQQHTAKSNNSKTVAQIQNITKNYSYLEKATTYKRSPAPPNPQVVDCIELLDSSDEESSSASHYRPSAYQSRTPQKRTLLAAKGSHNKYSSKNDNTRGHIPSNFTPQIRKQTKKPAPLPLPPATPQSNFLNAVQLQPAAVTGVNPPAFSALLSNKSVIIPNAFYGNHPSVRDTFDIDMDRRYVRWLENFLNQFCNSQLVATHSCFVFLQKSLKYKDFVRIKAIRANMNTHAQSTNEQLNKSLMAHLRAIVMKNNRDLTTQGRRFCELTCNSPIQGKAVTLLAHGSSGRVTMKTCNMEIARASQTSSSTSTSSSTAANTSLTRKRQLEEDEDEYMPDKQKLKTISHKPPSENGDSGETSEDRKRSLRTKRTKRLDNSFSYNEDDLLAEYEIDDEEEAEKIAQAEVQRKIENKRLEAQKQRQQQVKSFESAFIQAFTKSIDGPTSSSSKSSKNASNQRIRFKNSTPATATSIRQYTANNDAEDLLQATWIENAENDDTQVISDDDEPKVHRIYKQQQKRQYQQQKYQPPQPKLPTKFDTIHSLKLGKHYKSQQEEVITGDDDYIENDQFYNNPPDDDRKNWPKNVDLEMHVNGKFKDKCVICYLNCQRIVHHYVNEHRGCEVYNSRLTTSQIQLLRNGNCSESSMSMYKNGQPQYEAYCIFCQKQSRFMLPYWFQHFTMHTGEYAYRCTGCGVRKPTRSLLTQHQSQGCPQSGGIKQDYSHDPKSVQVEARVCKLCNYVQLHRSNIVKHLHQQHNVKRILPRHIQTIVLLKTPSSTSSPLSTTIAIKRQKPPTLYNQASSSSSSPSTNSAFVIEDDDTDFAFEQEEPSSVHSSTSPTGDPQNHYYNYIPPYMQAGNAAAAAAAANFTWEDNDPAEDLSFMICGMLDVQMNNSE